MPADLVIATDVQLATRDYGGPGQDVLLLHGGGRSMDDWRLVAPLLVDAGLRVAAMDLRGHGRSGPALWGWQDGMADVGAVVDRLGLVRPAIVGHSLGGMVAALWATAHEDCPLAVNVDGHGNPREPERYAGLDPPAAVAAHAAMREFIAAGLGARPDPALARLVEALDEIDLFAAYRAARCPLLVVSGARPDFEAVLPEPASGAFAAYRACVARDLAALAAANPLVSAFSLPAGHDVHLELPRELTDLVLSRLGS